MMANKLIEVIYYEPTATRQNILYDDNEFDIHLAKLLYKISNDFISQSVKNRMETAKKKGE